MLFSRVSSLQHHGRTVEWLPLFVFNTCLSISIKSKRRSCMQGIDIIAAQHNGQAANHLEQSFRHKYAYMSCSQNRLQLKHCRLFHALFSIFATNNATIQSLNF